MAVLIVGPVADGSAVVLFAAMGFAAEVVPVAEAHLAEVPVAELRSEGEVHSGVEAVASSVGSAEASFVVAVYLEVEPVVELYSVGEPVAEVRSVAEAVASHVDCVEANSVEAGFVAAVCSVGGAVAGVRSKADAAASGLGSVEAGSVDAGFVAAAYSEMKPVVEVHSAQEAGAVAFRPLLHPLLIPRWLR
ncbi:hypothetical protein RUND412_010481 [Rhizina undulata]